MSRQRVNAFIKSGRLVALRLPSGDYLLTAEDVENFAAVERMAGRPRINRDGILTSTVREHINSKERN